jgi:hypothetical protein
MVMDRKHSRLVGVGWCNAESLTEGPAAITNPTTGSKFKESQLVHPKTLSSTFLKATEDSVNGADYLRLALSSSNSKVERRSPVTASYVAGT